MINNLFLSSVLTIVGSFDSHFIIPIIDKSNEYTKSNGSAFQKGKRKRSQRARANRRKKRGKL